MECELYGISFCNVANILLKGLIELIERLKIPFREKNAQLVQIVRVFLKQEQWIAIIAPTNINK